MASNLKVSFIGESSVGKTTLLKKYCYNVFEERHLFTVGSELYLMSYYTGNQKNITLNCWDISGHNKFKAFIENNLVESDIIVLMFDLSNKSTFDNLGFWRNFIKKDCPIILCGTKSDLERKVSQEDIDIFIEQCVNLGYKIEIELHEVSTINNFNLHNLFKRIIKNVLNQEVTRIEINNFNESCNGNVFDTYYENLSNSLK